MLQAEVIEGHHGDEKTRKRHQRFQCAEIVGNLRKLKQARKLLAQEAQDNAQNIGHEALEERDEQRGV